MDDQQIADIIHHLEKAYDKQKSTAKFKSFGEVALYANKDGYLQMAIEMLKCAIGNNGDLHSLFNQDSDFGIDFMTLTEEELKFYSS